MIDIGNRYDLGNGYEIIVTEIINEGEYINLYHSMLKKEITLTHDMIQWMIRCKILMPIDTMTPQRIPLRHNLTTDS